MKQETAFVEMIKENEVLIFKVTSIYGKDEADKQDLYQEIVLQLWRSFKKFRHESNPSTWIYRIALNTSISKLRKEKKSTRTIPYNAQIHSLMDTHDTVLEERSRELHQQIAKLNDIEKAIILLYLESKSQSEIASIIGMTESNVSTRMVRIREKLKKNIIKQA